MGIKQLEEILRQCWTQETSANPDKWTKENPSYGQCAITALVVNDYLGGKLVWAEVEFSDGKKESHYFNEIDGKQYDLTRNQFPEGTVIPKGEDKTKGFPTTRDYVLSFPKTVERYNLLRQFVRMDLVNELFDSMIWDIPSKRQ